ncbi:MAG: aminotransferase class III-fold pyridoxal phosphate-dependent enzyme [Reinekea sp.]
MACALTKLLSLLNFNRKIIKAEGSYLFSEQGEAILDVTSQYGAIPFGHNPQFLMQELIRHAETLPGTMIQPFNSAAAVELARKLIDIAPGQYDHVIFACSGTEVVEAAIKMARAKTKRQGILSTQNSFHGKTMAASLATGNAYYYEPFHRPSDDFNHIPYNDLTALETALKSEHYAAFIVEPIQGEGGMITPSEQYLNGCEVLCARYGTLFVLDEIQVGLGRTGKIFACEGQAQPDILLVAKALGGGLLPISACIANKKAWTKEFGQRHSSTFANNNLSASIAISVIDKLCNDPAILENVNKVGEYLKSELIAIVSEYPTAFAAANGYGFMQGLQLTEWQDSESYMVGAAYNQGFSVPLVASFLLNRHLVFTAPTLNAHNVLRIQPSYLTTKQQVDQLLYSLRSVAEILEQKNYGELFRAAIGLKPQNKWLSGRSRRLYKTDVEKPKGEKLGTFAFLIHATEKQDAVESMPGGSGAFSECELSQVSDWISLLSTVNPNAAPAFHIPFVPTKNGDYVDGWLISSTLTPREMMRLPKQEKAELLQSYVASSQSKNVNIIGLGAFTSVISKSGTLLAECGTPVTTGNAYTALTSTDSIRSICQLIDRNPAQCHIGIVGATGSVGRLVVLDLAHEFDALHLIGNARHKQNVDGLKAIAGEWLTTLYLGENADATSPIRDKLNAVLGAQAIIGLLLEYKDASDKAFEHIEQQYIALCPVGASFPIILSNSLEQQLVQCDIVVTATSNGEAFIKADYLKHDAIVCDVARPSDLTSEVQDSRPDVIVYEGGLVNLPAQLMFGGPNIVGLKPGVSLACLSETIILCMAQVNDNYSIGGTSSLKEARTVFDWGTSFGFNTYIPDTVLNHSLMRNPAKTNVNITKIIDLSLISSNSDKKEIKVTSKSFSV